MSLPEVMLWQRLRANATGLRFRRQHPIGPFVVDFYCSRARLVIEIDGEAHSRGDRPGRDAARDELLEENGYGVMRVSATDVLRDVDGVLASIVSRVAAPLHQPLAGPPPRAGEE